MTLAELERAVESKKRVIKRQAQEKAYFDYTLAELIGRSVSRIYNSSNRMPDIAEAYPTLFDVEEVKEQKQARQDELSALRFKQFANFHNNKIKEEAK